MKAIPLSGKSGVGLSTLVSDCDYDKAKNHRWYLHSKYVVSNIGGKYTQIHRLILGFPEEIVDHKNGNTLDNRRENLRLCNYSQNGANRKANRNNKLGIKGVFLQKGKSYKLGYRISAQIKVNGINIRLGYFDTTELAERAYKLAAKRYFGEFAKS